MQRFARYPKQNEPELVGDIVMVKESWPDENHVRVTSDDGRKSWLYETDGCTRTCTEVADHHGDGTTDAYESDNSVVGQLLFGGKGKHK